ncbi:MAG: ATP-binding protein [Melioribacteraceae bacterium]|nr:ATP-binding protein [Melioribacteraceae bacterium]MCF8355510.1 ATP-binding protein [Melioribacteraceae bacterium]MCF8394198.1 ATP-binding protein [Melioribacteraceae bacterium]
MEQIENAFASMPITILIGARQVGKTTLLKNLHLSQKHIYLIGQDPETALIFEKASTAENYLRINLQKELNGVVLLDEFQFINNISTILKLLTDSFPNLKIICSGSSSLDIIQKVEESLAGRVRVINVFSLSFSEYLKFQDESLFDLYTKYDYNTVDEIVDSRVKYFLDEYLLYGGLPRAALNSDSKTKITLLNEIYKTYLLRDVRNYVKNEDAVGFNKLLIILASQIGNMISINELSSASGLPYRKCEDYLFLLEQMFIVKLIEPYFTNKRKVIRKMKKVYFTDLGLRNIIFSNFNELNMRNDSGAIFENYVLLEILKIIPSYAKIYYYRTKDGSEVDFIIDDLKNKYAFEVKYKRLMKKKLFKNITSLEEILNIRQSFLININMNSDFEKLNFIQGYFIEKIRFN